MKVVALIPFWEAYESNEFRAKKISGRYLLSYTLEKLNKVKGLDAAYVYASNDSFAKYVEGGLSYTFLQRPESLDCTQATMEDIIQTFFGACDADVVVLIHPTSPLLKAVSIQRCLNNVVEKGCDSSFAAVEHKKFGWHEGNPINYDVNENIPKLVDIEPLYLEQSSLYVFTKEIFLSKHHRIAGEFKISIIDSIEGLEVRNEADFELLELIINSGMYEGHLL